MNLQSIFDIPEICARLNVRHAVISPGSRNGALTIAFARHPKITCYSIPDERSAAFVGLGLSLQTGVPTVLICTSGSAGLNYFPAIAEAFFNRVPLLILTADRPAELVNIRDGQTIFQNDMYGRHVKKSYAFPADDKINLARAHHITAEAVQLCSQGIAGPVHINIPFEEPFYPEPDKEYPTSANLTVSKTVATEQTTKWPRSIMNYHRVLCVVGQGQQDKEFKDLARQLKSRLHIPLVADVTSNMDNVEGIINHHDFFLNDPEDRSLHPDLVVTFGLSILSKKLKALIRGSKASHWHVDINSDSADTFNLLDKEIAMSSQAFLSHWLQHDSIEVSQTNYLNRWQSLNTQSANKIKAYEFDRFTESQAYKILFDVLPDNLDLHLANSMAVRYANLFRIKQKNVSVYCNRGTSGIDGSNSTAVGSAIASQRHTLLVTGDVSFLYDRNAFWHNHVPDHLQIIVFNNGGGGIFRLIKGPSGHPEMEPFFETIQNSNAQPLAGEFGFEYFPCYELDTFSQQLDDFFRLPASKKILEIFTPKEDNEYAFKLMMKRIAN